MKNDLTIIILTFNEELHIERCLQCVGDLTNDILVVDSFSNDETCNIARSMNAVVKQNPFVNQAQQFQWAIDNCDVKTDWIFRLDADEIIDEQLVKNIRAFVESDGFGHNAAIFHRKHIFLGKWVKHGGRYPLAMLRIFRRGCAHIEQRWMDEHIILDKGTSTFLAGGFADDNLNTVTWFIDKHNKYATREMVDIMLKRLDPDSDAHITKNTGFKIRFKRFLKQSIYMKLPYFVRPFIYFNYRYFIQLGFLDGSRGFAYHFMQAFWYRALVDLKCIEIERDWQKASTKDEKINIIEMHSGYLLTAYKCKD
jgi:glycosyltransferase involved in cell wall biosynthesis